MVRLPFQRCARALGRQLFPSRCQICGDRGALDREVCVACSLALAWHTDACPRCAAPLPEEADDLCFDCQEAPPPLQACWASLRYEGALPMLLRRFKFHEDLPAGRLCAQLMQASPPPWDVPVLCAVPLHAQRLRRRGYNQAGELVRLLGAPRWDGLRRIRATAPQSERNAADRRRNLVDAFAVVGRVPPAVILVDDVMTTGSTLAAAAEALHAAGCREVRAWVCARVP